MSLFSLFVLFVLAKQARASVYMFERGGNNSFHSAHTIDIEDSTYYIYGILSPGQSTIDYYQLDFASNLQQIEVRLLIPDKSPATAFKPNLVLTDGTTGRLKGEAPFGFPREKGGSVYNWQGLDQQRFADLKIDEKFIVGPGMIGDFVSGQHLLAVFDPQGIGGRYVLKVGSRQGKESLRNRIESLIAYIRIKLQIY